MKRYRIHRMKDSPREQFRWSPHTGGLAVVKPKDYEPPMDAETPTPYALWKRLSEENAGSNALSPGDLLEDVTIDSPGTLLVAKYIGFEPAEWFVPVPKSDTETPPFTADRPDLNFSDSAKA